MATARTAAVLGLEELAQADGALGSRGNQRHDLLGELREGLRDRLQVLAQMVVPRSNSRGPGSPHI